jgi:hypothetical protein
MGENKLFAEAAQRKKNRQQKKPQSGELNLCLGAERKDEKWRRQLLLS